MSNKKLSTINSVKEIMEKMGFNKNAPIDTQKAFYKHLLTEYTNYNDKNQNSYENKTNMSLNSKSNKRQKKVEEFEQLDLFKKAS